MFLFRVCCVPVDTTHDFVSLSGHGTAEVPDPRRPAPRGYDGGLLQVLGGSGREVRPQSSCRPQSSSGFRCSRRLQRSFLITRLPIGGYGESPERILSIIGMLASCVVELGCEEVSGNVDLDTRSVGFEEL